MTNGLKRARYDVGLSLDELAERTGIAAANLSRIENGHRFPNAPTAKKIADALGLRPSDLFFDEQVEAPA